ncbi:hypothetical protein AOL_s00097g241 [Orbilia oligospora ATCC 24927]|uniref:Uncharacterized protein n=1 Tax=Arthrobotrys oligospora (strain ATCC 24927 / CBS 115.81 / DSM 1491) TaxID=756982 RepID=G1XIR4_ARTOA|nr:hypothetical protein AOL_s00097g241 [Orbilia oligospora ATCC 24927]EGX46815.1 hypothetical protein AOL_s00097g241 [Orbilia oligospora ATCC 24927]
MESPAGPSGEPSAPLPSPPPSNSSDEPQNLTHDNDDDDDDDDDDLLALVKAILGSDVNLDVSSKLLQAISEAREGKRDEDIAELVEELLLAQESSPSASTEAKSSGKGVAGVGTNTYGESTFSIPSNLYDYIGTSEPTSQRNPSFKFIKRNLEEFPFPPASASLYLNKRELLNGLSRAQFATRIHPNHIFGFNDKGQLYDHGVRDRACWNKTHPESGLNLDAGVLSFFTDFELETVLQVSISRHLTLFIEIVGHHPTESYRFYMISFLEFLTENSLKSIFAGHGFNFEFLQSLIPHTVLKGSTAGYRSLSDGSGTPMSYDIYFLLPLKQVSSGIEFLVPALGRSNLPRIDPRSALDIYPEIERNPGSKVALIDITNLAITLKYDVATRKTSVLLQTPMPEFVFPLLQGAFENSQLEKEEDQRDPFFILVLVLRNWFEVWKTTKIIVQGITEWLDVKVQDFVTSKGNEVLYNDINSKLHYTHHHLSQINVEIAESNSIFQMVHEQHTNFLKFTGLKSEMSIGIKEQLARLELDLKILEFDLRLELDKIKTSSTWLSTSISLKHAEAMRIANEESRKASLALKENTEAMKVIAELNQQDTLAMKENTDVMKNNGTLLRELAQATLKSNEKVQQNGDAMRQIAVESQKITEANSKETEIMTQIAVSTQKDGQSMKVLAFLTMMYLPGALVSSVFGWSIISFEVGDDGIQHLVMAKQWWLFAVSTLGLTVLTMAGCFIWIWMSRKNLTIDKAKIERAAEDENTARQNTP